MALHALIVAAGSGTRFGGELPKQLADLRGRPLLAWSLEAFSAAGVDTIVIAAPERHRETVAVVASSIAPGAVTVAGGETRSLSVRLALEAVAGDPADTVLIHDAARPLVTPELIARVTAATARTGAATPAVVATDTLVEATDSTVTGELDRSRIHRIQTPQGFRLEIIAEAHRRAELADDVDPTDDAGLVRRHLAVEVTLVTGEEDNLKITTPTDLVVAETVLARRLTS